MINYAHLKSQMIQLLDLLRSIPREIQKLLFYIRQATSIFHNL